ncbi:hypothetical protein KR018_007675 [Drosophila ironensis]|nr:hypothetical protein KR018_007675 [Drosophila ironensis]
MQRASSKITGTTNQADARKKPRHEEHDEMRRKRDSSDSETGSVQDEGYTVGAEDPNILRIGIIADAVSASHNIVGIEQIFAFLQEVTLGFLLAGVGYHRDKFRNYLMVDNDTTQDELENFFSSLYRRTNMGIIMIDFNSAKRLKSSIGKCKQMLPVLVTVPTKATLMEYLEKKEKKRRLRQRDAY